MSVYWKIKRRAAASAMVVAAILAGCGDDPAEAPQAAQALAAPVTVKHQLGTTTVANVPRKVAVLDMNEADFLDQLGVPIAGMTKDYVPHFLSKYKDAPDVQDLGAIVQPNLERVHALKPDLILITPIQANHYQELSEIAPTLHFDVDYKNSQRTHIATVRQHLLTLGRIFDKEALAKGRRTGRQGGGSPARDCRPPEKAMIVMHNNGAFSAFGVQSRYAFVFDALGVRPASTAVETSLHGQPISSEFIQEANPDILYVVDRSAVMERRPVMDAERMANPLLRQTNAWKNGRVVFVDADAWYITAASVTSLTLLIDDVIKGYRR